MYSNGDQLCHEWHVSLSITSWMISWWNHLLLVLICVCSHCFLKWWWWYVCATRLKHIWRSQSGIFSAKSPQTLPLSYYAEYYFSFQKHGLLPKRVDGPWFLKKVEEWLFLSLCARHTLKKTSMEWWYEDHEVEDDDFHVHFTFDLSVLPQFSIVQSSWHVCLWPTPKRDSIMCSNMKHVVWLLFFGGVRSFSKCSVSHRSLWNCHTASPTDHT